MTTKQKLLLTETDINTIAQLHNVAPGKVRATLKADGFKILKATA